MTALPRYLDVHRPPAHDPRQALQVFGAGRTPDDALANVRLTLEAGGILREHAVYLNTSQPLQVTELDQLRLTDPFVAALWLYARHDATAQAMHALAHAEGVDLGVLTAAQRVVQDALR